MADPIRDKAFELYGPGIAAFLDHAEIGSLIRDAADRGDAPDIVVGRLRNTEWWKRTQDSARRFELLRLEDPAEAERQIAEGVNTLRNLVSSIGLTVGDQHITDVARDALRFGWNEDEVRQVLVAAHDWSSTRVAPPGQLGELVRRARSLAEDYMVSISDETLGNLSRRWVSGQLDEAGVRSYMEQAARQRWAHNTQIVGQLDKGFTVREMVDPLRERIAQTLEMSPAMVDFNDSYFQQALTVDNGDGTMRLMNDAEVMRLARGHDEFEYTGVAAREGAQMSNELLKLFGERR